MTIYTGNTEAIGTTGTSDVIFNYWVRDQTTTASNFENNAIWRLFMSTSTTGGTIVNLVSDGVIRGIDYTDSEMQARIDYLENERKRMAREAEAKRIAEQRRQREAQARAEILLKQALTPAQKAQLKRFGYFFVQGNKTGKTYRIRNGRSLNVDEMCGNKPVLRYCAHPVEDVPNMDTMLVQKIYLECMEDEFLKIANRQAYVQ